MVSDKTLKVEDVQTFDVYADGELFFVVFLYLPSEPSETGGYTVFTFVCVCVCPCVHLWALIFRCKYLENGL